MRSLDLRAPHHVWVAEHHKTHEVHVFKFANDGLRLRALQREVALSRLFALSFPDSPHFVRIADWNFDEAPYFTEAHFGGLNLLEFGETPDFQSMAADGRALLVAQIASAVADAHSIGVLHNDIKPSNVLVFPRNGSSASHPAANDSIEPWLIRVVDFGIASLHDLGRLQDLEITDHGQFADDPPQPGRRGPHGSPLYAAPELRREGAKPDTRADVYALGVLLFQVLCGDFSAPLSPGWETHIADPLLQKDIADACNLNPDQRTSSPTELAQRLRSLLERRANEAARADLAERRIRDAQELLRARARQPWIAATVTALLLGMLGTAWFFHRATQQRNQAIARSQTLAAMNQFLVEDLLSQANPAASRHSGPVQQETLLDAIRRAEPRIDSRFSQSPEAAASIHEALANAFGALGSYSEAHREYQDAATRFQQAGGSLSQQALQAELRDIVLHYIESTPQALDKARSSLAAIRPTLDRVPSPTPELQGWEAMASTADILTSDTKADAAAPLLEHAITTAHRSPGYDPALLTAMELRLCGVYLKENRGGDAVQTAQTAITGVRESEGPDSPALFVPEMYLEEGLYLEHRNHEAEVQSAHDYSQFLRLLGPDSRLTLSALDMHAQVEGALENNAQAIQDWLKLYELSSSNPSAQFFSQTAIVEAGQMECHSGKYFEGEQDLRRGLDEIKTHGGTKALNFSVGSLSLAECMLAQREDSKRSSDPALLTPIKQYINNFDLPVVRSYPGTGPAEGYVLLAKARLAFQQQHFAEARQLASQAEPLVKQPGADSWEQNRLLKLDTALRQQGF